MELAERKDGLLVAVVRCTRRGPFEHPDECEHRSREDCAAKGD